MMNSISNELTVAFSITHPTHVHLYKNVIKKLNSEGYETYVFTRKNDVNIELLDNESIDYDILGGRRDHSIWIEYPIFELNVIRKLQNIMPDVVVSEAGVAATHGAKLAGSKSVLYLNNEHAKMENYLSKVFADVIYTPNCYEIDYGKKQIKYNSYYPLAYTHPDYFTPDQSVLEKSNIKNDESYIILRLVSWEAVHDKGVNTSRNICQVVTELEKFGSRVLISAEGNIPAELEDRQISVEPYEFHDLLYYADLYIGEGAATATESALLGTPSILINPLYLGYVNEIQNRYGLIKQFSGENRYRKAIKEPKNFLRAEVNWESKREKLINDKKDMNKIIYRSIIDNI